MKKFRELSEAVKDKFDIGEYDQEGDMAKSDLRSIIINAKKLHDMLEDSDNLPEWVQSKITKAEDYISTVANYMTAEMNEEVDQIDEISSDLVKKARDVAFAKGKDDQGHRFVSKAYEKGKKESDVMAKKINEISSELLQRYKKKASDQASAADKAGDIQKGNKRFSGIIKATNKQFANDMKKQQKEEVEQIDEKNVPTSPEKWARAKAAAKAKFAVYPSAYANGWASKKYKAMGGGWKSVSEAKDDLPFTPDKPKKNPIALAGKYGQGYSTAKHLAKIGMKKVKDKKLKETMMGKISN